VLLAAKTLVVAAAAWVVGQAGVAAMFFLARLVVGDRTIPIYAPAVAEEVPRLLALGASVVVVACVGLGLGVLTRSTAGALTSVTALLFVLPPLGQLLPSPWGERYFALTLQQLPQQLAGAPDAYLSPLGAAAAMAAYLAAALAAAWLALRVRDA
jgi:ABC-2 type transport system permease protein